MFSIYLVVEASFISILFCYISLLLLLLKKIDKIGNFQILISLLICNHFPRKVFLENWFCKLFFSCWIPRIKIMQSRLDSTLHISLVALGERLAHDTAMYHHEMHKFACLHSLSLMRSVFYRSLVRRLKTKIGPPIHISLL